MPTADLATVRQAWVRFCLAQRGHSITDAAEEVGCSLATVQRIIAGTRGQNGGYLTLAVWTVLEELTGRSRAELEEPPAR